MLSYVCMFSASGADLEARVRLLRYWTLIAAAVFAIAVPHILLPDRDLPFLQRLNRNQLGLLLHQLRQWLPISALFIVPGLLLAFWDPDQFTADMGAKASHAASTLLVMLGTAIYSFERYIGIGPLSQAWQEGTKGRWYRTYKENSPGGFSVPEGMVPAMLATQRVFAVGLLVLVAAAYFIQSVHPALALLPGGLLLLWSVARLVRRLPRYDHAYYATNAFYGEVFRSAGGVRVSTRDAVPYSAIYWAPPAYKPHVWAVLRQLDRKLPLGRLMALAHGLLWFLFYMDATPRTITVYLLMLMLAKNAASYVLTRPTFAPMPFQIGIQSERGWIITRFLVNLRWTMPLLLSLLAVAAFDRTFSITQAVLWTGLDVAASFVTAFLFTYGTEYRYRKQLT